MLQHLLFLPCTLGQLLKADGAFTNWSQRVAPLLFLVTKIQLLCSNICSYLTADYFLPSQFGLPNFSLFFLEVIQNTAAKPLPKFTLWHSWQTCVWTSPPSLLERCFLISISPWLNWSAMPNVLPAWLAGWPVFPSDFSSDFPLTSSLVFPSDFFCPEPAPPFLATSSLHGWYPGKVFVLSCFLRYLAFDNIHGSTLKILLIPVIF